MLHWEDFRPGHVTEYGPRQLSRAEIVGFAAEFDPQPMHLDDAAAAASMLGGLAASGWHSCCVVMRMLADAPIGRARIAGAPGVEEVRWRAPVRPGEPLMLRATVLERVPSDDPDAGQVKFLFELIDANGTQVMTMTIGFLFARAGAASRDGRDGTSLPS